MNTPTTYDIWQFGQDITRRLFLQADALTLLAIELEALLKEAQKTIEANSQHDEHVRDILNKIADDRKKGQ